MGQETSQAHAADGKSSNKHGSKGKGRVRLEIEPNKVFDSDEGPRTVYKAGTGFFYYTKVFKRVNLPNGAVLRTVEADGNIAPEPKAEKADGNRAAQKAKADNPKKAKKADGKKGDTIH